MFYVYILKLANGDFYVGQTKDLGARLSEHRDGRQDQTSGNAPRLVYFEELIEAPQVANDREGTLTRLNQSAIGQRRLRQIIERFRTPLRLLDLDA